MVLARGKQVLNRKELYKLFSSIGKSKTRAIVVMLYLTGARVGELLEVKKRNIKSKGEYWIVHIRTEKKFDIIKKIRIDDDRREFVTKERIEYRDVPINKVKDKEFLLLAWPWIQSKGKEERLFPISRQRVWQIMKKYDIFPHYLRHLRLTHLVSERGFTDQDLVQFTGWADSKPARTYAHLRWQDIAKKL